MRRAEAVEEVQERDVGADGAQVRHGGEIDAESRPGEGTTIRFWLETEKIELEDAEDEQ